MSGLAHPFLQRVATDGLEPALQAQHRRSALEIDKVRKASQSRASKKLKAAVRNVKRSTAVRISCLHKAGLRSDNPHVYLRYASQFDLSAPFEGVVPWSAMPKKGDTHRPIVNLPTALKARHYMIAHLIATQFDVPSFIYGLKGKGRDDLVTEVKRFLEDGYVHVQHADIKDCFDSINLEALYSLPLAKGDIENSLFPDNLRLVQRVATERTPIAPGTATTTGTTRGTIMGSASTSGPKGLLQGSPASNIILAYLLRELKVKEDNDVKLLLYSDNFLLMSRTEKALLAEGQSLAEQLDQSPFGPLVLVNKDRSADAYFEFLGYGFQPDPTSKTWEITPSQSNWDKLDQRHEIAVKADLDHRYIYPFHGDAAVRHFLTGFKSTTSPNELFEMYRTIGLRDLLLNEQALRANLRWYYECRGYIAHQASALAEQHLDYLYYTASQAALHPCGA